ncbi:hypothetical protein LZC95_24735 [Pendulispora brunnea]|uniref:Nucleoside phosphorylase domain-containing protein n=1 Tax=Pendulispora brunnea TaxID=2905690 RepID=A0ABZ2KMV6_9BACT
MPPHAIQDHMLILAAFPPELEPFSERYRKDARAIGVGLVTAAHATGALLASAKPAAVLLVGSCGVYPGRAPAAGAVVVATRTVLADAGVAQDQAALPPPMATHAPTDPAWVERFVAGGCLPAIVAGTLGIATDDRLAHALAERSGADVENLEAFAVAAACAAVSVPCVAVLGVTNVVGSQGRIQWRDNHRTVAARVVEIVERVLG